MQHLHIMGPTLDSELGGGGRMEKFTELIAGRGPACSCFVLRGLDTRPKVPTWNLFVQGRSHTESPNARIFESDPSMNFFSPTLFPYSRFLVREARLAPFAARCGVYSSFVLSLISDLALLVGELSRLFSLLSSGIRAHLEPCTQTSLWLGLLSPFPSERLPCNPVPNTCQ